MFAGALSTRLFGVESNPAEIPSDHPIVAATTEAIVTETGTTPTVYPAHVASDIRFPIRYLDAATVGPGTLAGAFYGPTEWVDAEDMHRATRVIVRIVSDDLWPNTVHNRKSSGGESPDCCKHPGEELSCAPRGRASTQRMSRSENFSSAEARMAVTPKR